MEKGGQNESGLYSAKRGVSHERSGSQEPQNEYYKAVAANDRDDASMSNDNDSMADSINEVYRDKPNSEDHASMTPSIFDTYRNKNFRSILQYPPRRLRQPSKSSASHVRLPEDEEPFRDESRQKEFCGSTDKNGMDKMFRRAFLLFALLVLGFIALDATKTKKNQQSSNISAPLQVLGDASEFSSTESGPVARDPVSGKQLSLTTTKKSKESKNTETRKSMKMTIAKSAKSAKSATSSPTVSSVPTVSSAPTSSPTLSSAHRYRPPQQVQEKVQSLLKEEGRRTGRPSPARWTSRPKRPSQERPPRRGTSLQVKMENPVAWGRMASRRYHLHAD